MALQSIIQIIEDNGMSWLIFIIILTSLIEISPIKINPWKTLGQKIIQAFTHDLKEDIDKIDSKLDDHIKEDCERYISQQRNCILDFASNILAERRNYTKEQYEYILKEIDNYEKECIKANIQNGVAEASINEIRLSYQEHLHNNSFL